MMMALKLSFEQLKTISSISVNLGHIFFASMVIPSLILPNTQTDPWLVPWGILLTISSWLASLVVVKKL